MQTPLPFPDFFETAHALDGVRLNSAAKEALQVHGYLTYNQVNPKTGKRYNYCNHPITNMWRGYEHALLVYAQTMLEVRQEYDSDRWQRLQGFLSAFQGTPVIPEWVFNPDIHRYYRCLLFTKMPSHYGPLFPDAHEIPTTLYPVPMGKRKTRMFGDTLMYIGSTVRKGVRR